MLNNLPFVSIIIPCRNEEKFIGKCLDSILEQDYPKEKLEVLVVDGMSEDKTREIIKNFQFSNFNFQLRLIENHKKFTPFGLNIGIKNAKGEIIIRMDAHAGYEKDYISKCAKCLGESGADNVGGVIKTAPAENTISARAIALSISHFWGAGGSYFRTGSDRPREVDTVFGGCYKREVFEKIGFFDERLIRSQDIEFNKRLKKAGGKIFLFPDIVAYYHPQRTLSGFFEHNFEDGIWTIYPLKWGIRIFSLRHLLPLFLVLGVFGSLILGFFSFWFKILFILIFGSYLFLNLFFSLLVSSRKGIRLFPALFFAFLFRHFAYGLGSIWGLVRIILSRPA
ncbi:glycosyltransferase family 2 protein [Patescibacteria group bacterium]|nr:glycosyltransferase family 2 protein [Patescibacteria group bacterium]